MTCPVSHIRGLTDDIAQRIWAMSIQASGVINEAAPKELESKLQLARQMFVAMAVEAPHFASIKEIAFFLNISSDAARRLKNEHINKCRKERSEGQWIFKSQRMKP